MKFKEQILAYIPQNKQEENDKRVILDYIKQFPHNILLRDNEFAHITSSAIIMTPTLEKVLMVHHNIYNTWAWTGGHADGDTDLLYIALKEAREETGAVNIKPLSSSIASLDILPVWGHIKMDKYVCAHLHLNASYILITTENEKLEINEKENSDVRWIDVDEIGEYSNEPYMIAVYNKLIRKGKELNNNLK